MKKRLVKNKMTEFNLRKKREELFETELVGKTINAGRIFLKIIAQDREFLRLLKELSTKNEFGNDAILIKQIDKLAGSQLTK